MKKLMQSQRSRHYVIKKLHPFIKDHIGLIVLTVVLTLCAGSFSLVSPRISWSLIDTVMVQKNIDMLPLIVLWLIGVYFARLIFDSVNLSVSNKLLNRFTLRIRESTWSKLSNIPYRVLEKKNIGELKMRVIDDVDTISGFIKDQVCDYISNCVIAVVSLVITLMINWRFTLICCSLIPVVFILNMIIATGSSRVNGRIRDVGQEYDTFTYDALTNWREIKYQSAEKNFERKFAGYRSVIAKLGLVSVRYWSFNEILTDFKSNYLTAIMVYIVGAFFVVKGQITIGIMVAFSEYFNILFSAIDVIITRNASVRSSLPYYERLFDTLGLQEEDSNNHLIGFKKSIEFKNVTFSYDGIHNILCNLNTSIKKGERLLICGESGNGKSTFIKLLLGLYKPDSGTITIDGKDISSLNKDELYRLIRSVMQDSILFNNTIKENILVGADDHVTEDDLIMATKNADIYDFIKSLPKGFDTNIGEGGTRLSGGQRQRIAIARALITKPQVVIFDEATSSVDGITEDAINESLGKLDKNITVMVVTHKPRTIHNARAVKELTGGKLISVRESAGRDYEFIKNGAESDNAAV